MKITKSQACQILGVSEGASLEEIRSSYKHLARKWHPDKQDGSIGSEEATRRFQEVSAAYKKLTSNEKDFDEDGMTLAEMMELYRQFFSYGNPMGQCNCPHHHHPLYQYNDEMSDYDDYDYTDDDDSDEEFWESIASRLRSKYEAKKYMPKDSANIPRSGITEEEALRNAQELIEEEETEKRRKEKKKAKKKKKKEKKKQKEKEKIENIEKDDTIDEKQNSNGPVQNGDEKIKTVNSNTHLPNGISPSLKNETKNKSNTKNIKKLPEYIEKIQKPVQIVQEDIRPSLPKEVKEEKGSRLGTRSSKNKGGSDEEEQFDASSAFFARAASKAPHTQPTIQQPPPKDITDNKPKKKDNSKKNGIQKNKEIKKTGNKLKQLKEDELVEEPVEQEKDTPKVIADGFKNETKDIDTDLDSIIIRSRQLAVRGNDFAQKEEYLEAVKMFTEAIILDPSDFRFFGNRSYCYDRTGQFEYALEDAESAIRLAPQWPKGYFRKGRALMGLQRYQEAEAAFQHVLTLDAECPDAQFELEKVRVQILTDMGFQTPLAEESVRTHGTVQSALEALLAGNVTPRSDKEDDDLSADENYAKRNGVLPSEKKTPILVTTSSQPKIKQRCTALWVGNVNSYAVTEKQLSQLFAKYGKLVSVRLLPEKYCAFINYQLPEDAGKALEKLQGFELGGQNLLIRYPNNPPPGSMVIPNEKPNNSTQGSKKIADKNMASKITGPVNGNECYFWRTTGCVFDGHCRYRHVSEHKGVDLAKVQAKYGTHL